MIRVSVRWFVGLIGLCAIGFAALKSASEVWIEIIASLKFLGLATAIVGTIFRRGSPRAFWTGFAVFGWLSLITSWSIGPFAIGSIDRNVGHRIASLLHPYYRLPPNFPTPEGSRSFFDAGEGIYLIDVDNKLGNAEEISLQLFGVFKAMIGGAIAVAFAAKSRKESATDGEPRSSS